MTCVFEKYELVVLSETNWDHVELYDLVEKKGDNDDIENIQALRYAMAL